MKRELRAGSHGSFWRRKSHRARMGRGVAYLLLIVFSLMFSVPFLWSLSSSLKDVGGVYAIPMQWIPEHAEWTNYVEIFQKLPLHRFFGNTLIITAFTLVGQVFSAAVVAFAFARLRWPGRDVLFIVMLSTMMLPAQVLIIPHFILFQKLGWVNTFKPLIVPAYFGGGAFYIFLMRQYFKTIPLDLEDAARIDGCSTFRVFWQIMLPLSKPVVATIIVFSFIQHWNEFMGPLIYLQSYRKYPIALGINMFKSAYAIFPHYLMAASVVALIPILIIFFFAQRYMVRGIVLTGMKS